MQSEEIRRRLEETSEFPGSQDDIMKCNDSEHEASVESESVNDQNKHQLLGSELERLSRKELQALAKARGFKANLKV
jgi:hypothetical protein